jgi:hypothetical protein
MKVSEENNIANVTKARQTYFTNLIKFEKKLWSRRVFPICREFCILTITLIYAVSAISNLIAYP